VSLQVSTLPSFASAAAPVEMVERKGLGHPDTICDGLAESLSRALSRYYLERFGFILHHNVDKGLLWGGAARPGFGGGKIVAPIEIYLAGRATREFKGIRVPVEEIAAESTRQWLKEHLRYLNPEQHVRIHCLVRPSSPDLIDLFLRGQQQNGVMLANDTSCGAGFAPLSRLERAVLGAERFLNSQEIKSRQPEIGEDIKVMGVRRENQLVLTIACAFVDRHVADLKDYFAKKNRLQALVNSHVATIDGIEPGVALNAADGETPESIYLTVTGSSAESGDDGQVGRGNRVNGLITPYRPMTIEAAAGKNPVTHVGKLYNVAAHRISQRLVTEIEEVEEASCWLVSQIGHPVDQPQVVDVRVALAAGARLPRARIAEVVQLQLAALQDFWRGWLREEHTVF